MIEGVVVKPLKRISDERGSIMHMVRKDDPDFIEFGEIYFSTINPNFIKAWRLHKKMTLNYVVVKGMIKLVLYDERENSPTEGKVQEIFIGDENYCLVHIPLMVWNGFACVGEETAIVANLATIPHDPLEIERVEAHSEAIPYKWEINHR